MSRPGTGDFFRLRSIISRPKRLDGIYFKNLNGQDSDRFHEQPFAEWQEDQEDILPVTGGAPKRFSVLPSEKKPGLMELRPIEPRISSPGNRRVQMPSVGIRAIELVLGH